MCLWCEVEGRVYRSYEEQEIKALEQLETIQQEFPGGWEEEECLDRPHCVWEKKLEFVLARLKKERLATELAWPNRCGGAEDLGTDRPSPSPIPAPTLPPHLLLAFERYIERMFERLSPKDPSQTSGVKTIPNPRPIDQNRETR